MNTSRLVSAAFALAFALLGHPQPARATLYVYEGFNYPVAAGGLAGQNGGAGWAGPWDTQPVPVSIVGAGLGYTDPTGRTLLRSGQMAQADGRNSAANCFNFRTADTVAYSGNVLYVSFLGQKLPGTAPDVRAANLAVFNTATELVSIGHGTNQPPGGFSGEFRWGHYTNGNGANGQVGDTTFSHYSSTPVGHASFLVEKIEVNAMPDGKERLTLYVNPPLGAEPAAASAVVITTREIATSITDLTRFRPFAGGLSANLGASVLSLDEIRAGSTWADVTPHSFNGRVWDGDLPGGSPNWSQASNWNNPPLTPPTAGNNLLFPAGVADLTTTFDLTNGIDLGNLNFAANYSIGNGGVNRSFDLSGGITVDGPGATGASVSIAPNVAVLNPQSFTVADAGDSLTFTGALQFGAHNITLSGAGTVQISHTIGTGTGDLIQSGPGRLVVTGISNATDVTAANGTLAGSGAVRGVTVTGPCTLNPGGIAGDITDDLTIAGSLFTLSNQATMRLDLHGTAAGIDYDQFDVTGGVALNGQLLVTAGTAFTPALNTVFRIIEHSGATLVSGTFIGLPEGAVFNDTTGRLGLRISYTGGTGNDVTLTVTSALPQTVSTWTGFGVDNNWTTPANWQGNVIPSFGHTLLFPAGALRLNNTNNFVAGTSFGKLMVTGSGYTLGGNRVNLDEGVEADFTGESVIALDLRAGSPVEFVVKHGRLRHTGTNNLSGHGVIFTIGAGDAAARWEAEGVMSGAETLFCRGPGQLVMHADNTFDDDFDADGGTLVALHPNAFGPGGTTTVRNGGVARFGSAGTSAESFILGTGGALLDAAGATLSGPIQLLDPAGNAVSGNGATLSGVISGAGKLKTVGAVTLAGSAANTFGSSLVEESVLTLSKPAGVLALPSAAEAIGSDARIVLNANEQIANSATVTVKGGAMLDAAGFDETIGGLVLEGSTATAGGGRIALSGNLQTLASAVPSVVTGEFQINAPGGTWTVADGAAAADLTIDEIAGAGVTVTRNGAGRMVATGACTLNILRLAAGDTAMNTSAASTTIQLNGGRLSGAGTLGAVTALAPGGSIHPGNFGTGILNTGAVTLNNACTLLLELTNNTAGTGHDQLRTTGPVNLAGAALNLVALSGSSAPTGTVFRLLDNTGAGAITGTFAGLAQGATVSVGDVNLTISYTGGTGNDVTLTAQAPPPPAERLWIGPINTTVNVNWSNPANWQGGGIPQNGDKVRFQHTGPVTAGIHCQNDLSPALVLHSIESSAFSVTISGAGLNLLNGLTVLDTASPSAPHFIFKCPVTLLAPQTWLNQEFSGALEFSEIIMGSHALTIQGFQVSTMISPPLANRLTGTGTLTISGGSVHHIQDCPLFAGLIQFTNAGVFVYSDSLGSAAQPTTHTGGPLFISGGTYQESITTSAGAGNFTGVEFTNNGGEQAPIMMTGPLTLTRTGFLFAQVNAPTTMAGPLSVVTSTLGMQVNAPLTITGPVTAGATTLMNNGGALLDYRPVSGGFAAITGPGYARMSGGGSVGIMEFAGIVQPTKGPHAPLTVTGATGFKLFQPSTPATKGRLEPVIDGPVAGTDYGFVRVTGGPVDINGAVLLVTLNVNNLPPFHEITLIDKQSAGAVTGTFSNLPENAEIELPNGKLRITYAGGTGNDVKLIVQPAAFAANDKFWTGNAGAGNRNWTTATNWNFNIAPSPGVDLTFDTPSSPSSINNFAAGTAFGHLYFGQRHDILSGSSALSIEGFTSEPGSLNFIAPSVTLTADGIHHLGAGSQVGFDGGLNLNGHDIEFTGGGTVFASGVSGGGSLRSNEGYLSIDGSNSFTATLTVADQGGFELPGGFGAASGGTTILPSAVVTLIGSGSTSEPLTHSGSLLVVGGDLTLAGPVTLPTNAIVGLFAVANVQKSLTISGPVSGAGGLQVHSDSDNQGRMVILSGANTYTGTTLVTSGALLFINGSQPSSRVHVNPGGVLGGTGTTGQLDTGSTIQPGVSGPGVLTVQGDLGFHNSTAGTGQPRLEATLNGTVRGTTYDGLNVNGNVRLANATLAITADAASVPLGTVYTLIQNNGPNPVDGAFAGIAEGDTITAGVKSFQISYAGGDGNDVTLTITNAPAPDDTWTGAGANGEWITSANWADSTVPGAGSDLLFPPVTVKTMTQSTAPFVTQRSLRFTDSGYSLGGQALQLSRGITASHAAGMTNITASLALTDSQTFRSDLAGGTLQTAAVFLDTHTLTLAGAGPVTVNGVISGEGGLTADGAANARLNVANTFTGPVLLTGASKLTIAHAGALGTSPNPPAINPGSRLVLTSGLVLARALQLNGILEAPSATLTGPVSTTTGGTLQAASGTINVNGLVSGSGGLGKSGAGIVRLNSNNTYSGTTNVSEGTLLVMGQQPNSAVTVRDSGTLGGTGRTGALLAAGIVSPGTSAGTLTVQGDAVFMSGATLRIEINGAASSEYDRLAVNGNVTAAGTLQLVVDNRHQCGDQHKIIDVAAGGTITGTFANAPSGGSITAGGFTFSINYTGGDGNDLVLTVTDGPANGSVWDGDGGAGEPETSSFKNWAGDVVPAAGDDLVFPAGITQVNVFHSFADDTLFGALVFEREAWNVSGNRFQLNRGLTVKDSARVNLRNGLFLQANQIFQTLDGSASLTTGPVELRNATLTIDGPGVITLESLTGEGALEKNGSGDLTVNGSAGIENAITLRRGLTMFASPNVFGSAGAGTSIEAPAILSVSSGGTVSEPLTLAGELRRSIGTAALTWNGDVFVPAGEPMLRATTGSIRVNGDITGPGGLRTAGLITLAGSNLFTGNATVTSSTLTLAGAANTAPFTVNSGAVLAGTGTVRDLTVQGTANPGTPGVPGTLFVNGALSFGGAGGLVIDLLAGGFDAMVVDLSVHVTEATLTLNAAPASVGASFAIVQNQSLTPVAGVFAGMPEGATFRTGTQFFQITYAGGDGNDIVVTRVAEPPVNVAAFSITPGTGQNAGLNVVTIGATGTPGFTYVVEASPDLQTWAPVSTPFTSPNGLFAWSFTESPALARRFYRFQLQ